MVAVISAVYPVLLIAYSLHTPQAGRRRGRVRRAARLASLFSSWTMYAGDRLSCMWLDRSCSWQKLKGVRHAQYSLTLLQLQEYRQHQHQDRLPATPPATASDQLHASLALHALCRRASRAHLSTWTQHAKHTLTPHASTDHPNTPTQ